jgi:hypothetical protein
MRFLVDEGVPVQVLEALRLNKPHEFDHVAESRQSGSTDQLLFRVAAEMGYDGLVALDVHQLADPKEWRALRASGLHHISLRQGQSVRGRSGVARVVASLVVAMPYIVSDLAGADSQRIVEVALLAAAARHETFDPRREQRRYPYWK